jgi:DNA-binding CsgD family transcriptional regulator
MSSAALSALLLDLYRYSRELPLAEFQEQALTKLRVFLAFDSAWWGVSAPNRLIHSSFPYQLPDHYETFYRESVRETDTLAQATLDYPGTAVHFTPDDMGHSPGLNRLTHRFGIHQALCASLAIPTLNLVTFLSLYRHDGAPQFTEEERNFLELVVPHMWATWSSNWTSNWIVRCQHGGQSSVSHAIADQGGTLHRAEPHFLELMRTEWPQWIGPNLPDELQSLLRTRGRYCGRVTTIHHTPVRGLTLLEIRMRSALESLTPRELAVATAFGEGQSHKTIALRFGISPATVRHYLRTIYAKTNVSNKAELANLLNESPELAAAPRANS